jgi:hypothetical protein
VSMSAATLTVRQVYLGEDKRDFVPMPQRS